jgi:hypothetical protein
VRGNWPQAGPTGGAAVFIPVGSAQPVANVLIADRIETDSETARELKTAKSKGRLFYSTLETKRSPRA